MGKRAKGNGLVRLLMTDRRERVCRGRASVWLMLAGLVIAAATAPRPAVAADIGQVFTVTGVTLDETARTATRARAVAIANGQREGLRRLFARLTPREDASRLPALDARSVTNMVAALEFDKERASASRYMAELTIRFNPERVRDLLRVTGIPFSETRAKPILVLPLFHAAGVAILWQDPNPWREAWRRYGGRGDLLPFVVPRGDLRDMASLSARDIETGERGRLSAIAERYGVSDVLVPNARLFHGAGGAWVLDVTMYRLSEAGAGRMIRTFSQAGGGDRGALLAEAVDALAGSLEEAWKLQTLMEFGAEITLEATVPLRDLADWLEVRRRLAQIASIRRIELLAMTVREAHVILHYLGNPSQLMLALAQSDVELINSEGAYSIVVARGTAGPAGSDRQGND